MALIRTDVAAARSTSGSGTAGQRAAHLSQALGQLLHEGGFGDPQPEHRDAKHSIIAEGHPVLPQRVRDSRRRGVVRNAVDLHHK